MSIINSQPLIGASGQGGYFLTKSLRFRASASAYLSRTFAANPTTRTQQTFSFWTKRGSLGSTQVLFGGYDGSSVGAFLFNFTSSDTLQFFYGGSAANNIITTQVFRDPSAWYHIVASIDSTQATASNRVKIYVNGVQITAFGTTNYPPQNTLMQFALNNANNKICNNWDNASNPTYDGYMAEINFIDGQALTPSSFGETSTSTGVWIPKKYTGTYGTNGFYLPFTNTTSTSTLGNDFSGNNNTWTVNNISLTSGATYDSMKDVPTLTDTDTANYCVLNPLNLPKGGTLSNGNLLWTAPSAEGQAVGTMYASSGKFYWEMVLNTAGAGCAFGIASITTDINNINLTAGSYAYYTNGNKYNGGSGSAYGATFTNGDIIGVALDLDAGTLVFYKNNTSQGTAFTGLSGTFTALIYDGTSASAPTYTANFGQRPFAYTPPTGFKALNTFNLPTPTIGATASSQANKYFNTVLWSGDGASTRAITGVGHAPDFVWIKKRTAGGTVNRDHVLYDIIRGTGANLRSNQTNAESTGNTDELKSFDSDGFSLGNGDNVNGSSGTPPYVGWAWKANGSGSTNTAGSITSTVSANTTAGFSIVTWTGNGTAGATVGHGLGVAPKMIIVKSRSNSATNWVVYHESAGNNGFLLLNSTNAFSVASTSWNNTSPTSTVFTLGNGTSSNANGSNQVGYCFSEVAGYSAFGSYTGNGSTNGTFVYTGFRPRFVLIKKIQTGAGNGEWYIHDTARDNFNQAQFKLYPSSSAAENGISGETTTTNAIDILSNGFKLRTGNGATNESSISYIYAAFAENPYKFSNAR